MLRGRTGRAFRAVRDSEVAAASSGVSLVLYKTLAFGVSAGFAGVAGSLFVLATNGYAQPDEFSVALSLYLLIGAAVAGLGSLWGVPVGAAFVALLPNISHERAADRQSRGPGGRVRPGRDPGDPAAADRRSRACCSGSRSASSAKTSDGPGIPATDER